MKIKLVFYILVALSFAIIGISILYIVIPIIAMLATLIIITVIVLYLIKEGKEYLDTHK